MRGLKNFVSDVPSSGLGKTKNMLCARQQKQETGHRGGGGGQGEKKEDKKKKYEKANGKLGGSVAREC